MTNIENLKNIVSLWASAFPSISRVWLFGSRAKNTYLPESDIDIAVEVDVSMLIHEDSRGHFMFEKNAMINALQKRIKHQIHLVHYDEENVKVFSSVSDHGVLLYDKEELQ